MYIHIYIYIYIHIHTHVSWASIPGIRVKRRGVRFHRLRDFKWYYFNIIFRQPLRRSGASSDRWAGTSSTSSRRTTSASLPASSRCSWTTTPTRPRLDSEIANYGYACVYIYIYIYIWCVYIYIYT